MGTDAGQLRRLHARGHEHGRGHADGTGGDGGAGSDLPYKEGRAVPLCLLSPSEKCGPLSSGYRGFPFWADLVPQYCDNDHQ